MRKVLLLLSCVSALVLHAQKQVRITDASILDIAPDVRRTKGAEQALAAAGIMPEQMDLVLQYGNRDNWPDGLKHDSIRAANEAYIRNYSVFRVCSYPLDTVRMAVLMVAAQENVHMPEHLRPLADFYLVLPERTLTEVLPGKPRPQISRGPRWKGLPLARIKKADEVYATYEVRRDSNAMRAFERAGMSRPEMDAVVFRSIETNWPVGINTFDKRYPRLSDFRRYKAYLAAEWDDKVLLIIPWDRNRAMPTVMRPYVDLYFVYSKDAVERRGGRKRR